MHKHVIDTCIMLESVC